MTGAVCFASRKAWPAGASPSAFHGGRGESVRSTARPSVCGTAWIVTGQSKSLKAGGIMLKIV